MTASRHWAPGARDAGQLETHGRAVQTGRDSELARTTAAQRAQDTLSTATYALTSAVQREQGATKRVRGVDQIWTRRGGRVAETDEAPMPGCDMQKSGVARGCAAQWVFCRPAAGLQTRHSVAADSGTREINTTVLY
ncbi:unnamed protein product [Prorocentrum cordatum]|uniref:Uncharacterized protein n=1 Tax=Prorocentrum cordatum TaxID=2364126 RepID=A0ABN9VB55_9DINO|nr:unnamed protein product [Polarella glacialis]